MVIFYFFGTVWEKKNQIVRSWIWDAATLSNIWFTLNWWIDGFVFCFFLEGGIFSAMYLPFPLTCINTLYQAATLASHRAVFQFK